MFGLIRHLLGPTKACLQGYIKQTRNILVLPIDVSDFEEKNQINLIPQVGQVVVMKEERIPRKY